MPEETEGGSMIRIYLSNQFRRCRKLEGKFWNFPAGEFGFRLTDEDLEYASRFTGDLIEDADGNYVQKDCATMEEYESSVHQLVFKDSVAYNEVDWPTVCNRRNA